MQAVLIAMPIPSGSWSTIRASATRRSSPSASLRIRAAARA